jgi:hypothetical protein
MVADQWDVQAIITRVNESLIARGYVTWFDCAPSCCFKVSSS